MPEAGGYYYLTSDVSCKNRASIAANANVHLCLNGYKVTCAAGKRAYSVYADGAVLNLCDCSEGEKGAIVTSGTYADNIRGSAVLVGAVTGAAKQPVMNMYSGTIDGSASTTQYGSALIVMKGNTFNMYGGRLIGGKTTTQGGIVHVDSTGIFNLYDGILEANEATAGYGGNVTVKGEFNMTGGTIKNGKSITDGANVYVTASGKANITGGTIEGGTGVTAGGADVFAEAGGVLNISGANIPSYKAQ